ncbi:MAG: hypothetical protein KTR20_12695 [Cellvibrionaceae bacterium]|nr:hypothetical protein [Cellvibrionaceae bacterium]
MTNIKTFKKKSVMAIKANAYCGTALAMNTEAGEIVVVCSNQDAITHAFNKLKPDDSHRLNSDALVNVAVIQEKDITDTRYK